MRCFRIDVKGIVQGVGFRPFAYNLAVSNDLNGYVLNNSNGVTIVLEGSIKNIKNFYSKLLESPPTLSKIANTDVVEMPLQNFSEFNIIESSTDINHITLISPDISICDNCRKELFESENKRYLYPFINCTSCGPRFSIISSQPYDRHNTTMRDFSMCTNCKNEYIDAKNRRFHAEPTACHDCGPSLLLLNKYGTPVVKPQTGANYTKTIIYKTIEYIKSGAIIGIKGLTGYHLCCDALNSSSITELRKRKQRPHKPFAIMVKNVEVAKSLCYVSLAEENLLKSPESPIVILRIKNSLKTLKDICPNQNTLGVMLPYTPLHHLIFQKNVKALIMTSANVSSLPLEYNNISALKNLTNFVDYFLIHNRKILLPLDDSVVRVMNNKITVLRRSRGYTPSPFMFSKMDGLLALGGNMKSTFSFSKPPYVFLSHHIGDLENLETLNHYNKIFKHYETIFKFTPSAIAHDLHPNYETSKLANKYNLPKIPIQHHHAHIASCMSENKVKDKVIGIAFDGTGYGSDGTIWGGEFLICNYKDYQRIAHFSPFKFYGGDSSIKSPWKIAVMLINYLMENNSSTLKNLNIDKYMSKILGENSITYLNYISKSTEYVLCSSLGRILDGLSSLINICHNISYEGQASIELETFSNNTSSSGDFYNFNILTDKGYIINFIPVIEGVLTDVIINNISIFNISEKIHNTIINASCKICELIKKEYFINEVALSGGIFQNAYLLEGIYNKLTSLGYKVYTHSQVPPNDGGISLGQLVIANEILKYNLSNK